MSRRRAASCTIACVEPTLPPLPDVLTHHGYWRGRRWQVRFSAGLSPLLLDQQNDALTPMLDAAAHNELKGARKLRTDSVTPAGDALRTNILAHIDYNKR